ncbi:MAG: hypothetical protein HC882_05825 [Acidobacteria bacterium]|nr:hypothetical protein [Acidobacteriota bacterium]
MGALAALLGWIAHGDAPRYRQAVVVTVVSIACFAVVRGALSRDVERSPFVDRFRCVARLERIAAERALELGQSESAQTRFRAALDCDPEDVGSLRGLGIALVREGKVDRGLAMVEKAAALAPRSARLAGDLSGLYLTARRPDEALMWSERALALEPRDLVGLFNRANAHAMRGDAASELDAWGAYVARADRRFDHVQDVRAARKRIRELERGLGATTSEPPAR